MVTEERSIENEWQVQTPLNYHQHIKIQNTKPKSRAEKIKSSSIRTTVANYNNSQIENPVVTFLDIGHTLALRNMVRKYM